MVAPCRCRGTAKWMWFADMNRRRRRWVLALFLGRSCEESHVCTYTHTLTSYTCTYITQGPRVDPDLRDMPRGDRLRGLPAVRVRLSSIGMPIVRSCRFHIYAWHACRLKLDTHAPTKVGGVPGRLLAVGPPHRRPPRHRRRRAVYGERVRLSCMSGVWEGGSRNGGRKVAVSLLSTCRPRLIHTGQALMAALPLSVVVIRLLTSGLFWRQVRRRFQTNHTQRRFADRS